MRFFSGSVSPEGIVKELEEYGVPLNKGKFGADPFKIGSFLRDKFYRVTMYGGYIRQKLSDAIIVLYKLPGLTSPFHYVAGIKTHTNGSGYYRFFNDSYYEDKYGGDYSATSITPSQYFELLRSKKCIIIKIWCVSSKQGGW